MSKEQKILFRKVVGTLGYSRHEVMPEWRECVLVKIREIHPIQRGLFSEVGKEVEGIEKIPVEQRKV